MSRDLHVLVLALLVSLALAKAAGIHKSKRSPLGLSVGGSATVTASPSARCRSQPVNGATVAYNSLGAAVRVTGGPRRGSDGYNWWQLAPQNCWTREDLLQGNSQPPAPRPPVPQPPAPRPPTSNGWPAGTSVYANVPDSSLRARSCAGGACGTVCYHGDRAQLSVVSGPQSADGYDWYQCRGASGCTGWSRADFLVRGNAPSVPVPQPGPNPQPQPPVQQGGFPLYKQCHQPYSSDTIGIGCSLTICEAGCAMSSLAMLISKRGNAVNPGQLNAWLKSNQGYAGCGIRWAAADANYGVTRYSTQIDTPSEATLCSLLNQGKGLLIWVVNKSHWVVVTGCAGNGIVNVNDPGYNRGSYDVSGIARVIVYN